MKASPIRLTQIINQWKAACPKAKIAGLTLTQFKALCSEAEKRPVIPAGYFSRDRSALTPR